MRFRDGTGAGSGHRLIEPAEILHRREGTTGAARPTAPPTPRRPAHREGGGDRRECQPRQNLHRATFMGPAYVSTGADPLARTIGKVLVFPNRNLGLELVDQPAAGREGDIAV